MITKTIILSTADWLEVSFDDTKDANWFTFRANADIEFAEVPSPAIDEIITLASWNSYWFDAPKWFWIRWAIGTEIYISPFDSIAWGWWGSWGSCSFDWVYQQPSGHVTGTSCQDWVDLHFPSQPPVMSLRWTPAFWLYEVGQTLSTPLIEWRWTLWSNPAGILTNLSIVDPVFAQANPTPWTWYWTNDTDVVIVYWNTKTYSWQVDDDQWRSANASGSYDWAYPYYTWLVSAWDLFDWITQAQLLALGDTNKIIKTRSDTDVTTSPTAQRYMIWYPASYGNLASIIDNSWFETISDYDVLDYWVVGLDWTTQTYRFYVLKNDTTQTNFTNQYKY